jgi:ATP-dependent RNA helicase DeaD
MTFSELGLIPALLDAVSARGFEIPTPIQAEMIPFLLTEERDVTGLAQTGTGKTAAFGLPILQKLNLSDKRTQALILAPTRELCQQVSREIADYGRNLKGLKTTTVYGGAAFGPQIRDLRAGAHVITATPGRLKDLLDKKIADLSSLRFLVLDEADQMLDMGFKDELDAILQAASPERQTLLFSATMPPEVARIASKYMKNPREIVAGEKNKGVSTVDHRYYRVHASDKYATLRRLIDVQPSIYCIVFCRTRDGVKDVAERLGKDGYAADALHGELSQVQRESVMSRFRQGNPSILVATDVAARGLDVDNLTHVIHFDLPDEAPIYNHRSGRTGRAGKTGSSLALVHMREGHRIHRIEQVLGRRILESRIPGGREICESRLLNLIDRVTEVEVNNDAIAPYLDAVRAKLENVEREELLRRFVSVEFNRFLEEYGNAADLNPPPAPKRTRQEVVHFAGDGASLRRGERPTGGMVRLRVNVGRRHSILPPQIIGLVNQATHSRDIRLGRIDINTEWSDIQVDASMAERVEAALRGFDFKGMKIRVERGADGRDHHVRPGSGAPAAYRGRKGPLKGDRFGKSGKKRKL